MKLNEEQSWIVTTSLLVLATLAVGVALHAADTVLIPFVLAIFVTVAIAPLVDIQVLRFRWPKAIAVINTMGLVLVALFLFILLMAASGHSMVKAMFEYKEMIVESAIGLSDQVKVWQKTDWGKQINLDKLDFSDFDLKLLSGPVAILAQKGGALVGNILSIAVITSIFVAFILAGRDPRKVATGIYKEIDTKIRKYIMAKVIYSAATGILVWIILAIVGLPMASLFGLLAFFLNFIPSIGSIVAWLLPIPIAFLSLESSWAIGAVIVFPGLVQIGIGNGLEPKAMGEDLELHPVTILLALSVWGLIWGIVGMVLAIPITASIRVVLMRFEATRPAGDLLAGRLPDA